MFCTECGKELIQGKKFCIYCGAPAPTDYIEERNIPESISDGDETEILIDEMPNRADDIKAPVSNEEMGKDATAREDDGGTLYLGLEAGTSSDADQASSGFSQAVERQPIVLKYKEHVIDETKVMREKHAFQKETSSGPGVFVKVLILIVICLLIAALGLGVYFYVHSQKPEKTISAPEINIVEEKDSNSSD